MRRAHFELTEACKLFLIDHVVALVHVVAARKPQLLDGLLELIDLALRRVDLLTQPPLLRTQLAQA